MKKVASLSLGKWPTANRLVNTAAVPDVLCSSMNRAYG